MKLPVWKTRRASTWVATSMIDRQLLLGCTRSRVWETTDSRSIYYGPRVRRSTGASHDCSVFASGSHAQSVGVIPEQRLRLCIDQLAELSPDVVALQEVRQIPDRLPTDRRWQAPWSVVRFAPATDWGGNRGLAILVAASDRTASAPRATAGTSRRAPGAAVGRSDNAARTGVEPHHAPALPDDRWHGARKSKSAVDRLLKEAAQRASKWLKLTVLMGDFNATPDSDELRFYVGCTGLAGRRTYFQRCVLLRKRWTHRRRLYLVAAPYTQRLRFLQNDRRFDYIFVSLPAETDVAWSTSCRIVLDRPSPIGWRLPERSLCLFAELRLCPFPPWVRPSLSVTKHDNL